MRRSNKESFFWASKGDQKGRRRTKEEGRVSLSSLIKLHAWIEVSSVIRIVSGNYVMRGEIIGYWAVVGRLKFLNHASRKKCRICLGDLTWRRRPGLTIGLGVSLIE